MAGLLTSPYEEQPRPDDFVGTLVLACRIQRTGIGFASKITDKLPYPAVMTNLKIWGNTVGTAMNDTLVLVDLTEENFTRAAALPVQPGDFFGWYPPSSSFDALNETGVGFGVFNTTQSHDFDCWVPVPSSTWRLRVSLFQQTAITPRVQVVATFKKLRTLVQIPGTAILPRGTLADPVCVRICDDGPKPPPPPPPGGGGGGPPPPPPPPPVTSLNPAVTPLPPPSEIDPFDPMGPGATYCAVDRYDPDK